MPRVRDSHYVRGNTQTVNDTVPDARRNGSRTQRKTGLRQPVAAGQERIATAVEAWNTVAEGLIFQMLDKGIIVLEDGQYQLSFDMCRKIINTLGAFNALMNRAHSKTIIVSRLRMSILDCVLDYYGNKMSQEVSDITSIVLTMILEN